MGSPQPGLQEEEETKEEERRIMKQQKSLRQLAKELGVSHSYLSQVKNGKRPASDKVVSIFNQSGKHLKSGVGRIRTYDRPVMSRLLCR